MECNELAEKVRDLHLQLEKIKQSLETVTESNYSQGMNILQATIGLKANAGGAIKKEIKRALDLLSQKTPTKKQPFGYANRQPTPSYRLCKGLSNSL